MDEFKSLRNVLDDLELRCDQVEEIVAKFVPEYGTILLRENESTTGRESETVEQQCDKASRLCQEINLMLNDGLKNVQCDKCGVARGFERQQWLAPRCGHLLCRSCMAELLKSNKEAKTFIFHCPVHGDATRENGQFFLPRIVTSASKVDWVDDDMLVIASSKVVHIKDDSRAKLQPDLETVPNIMDQTLLSKYTGWTSLNPRDNTILVQILDILRPLLLIPPLDRAPPNKVVIFSRDDRYGLKIVVVVHFVDWLTNVICSVLKKLKLLLDAEDFKSVKIYQAYFPDNPTVDKTATSNGKNDSECAKSESKNCANASSNDHDSENDDNNKSGDIRHASSDVNDGVSALNSSEGKVKSEAPYREKKRTTARSLRFGSRTESAPEQFVATRYPSVLLLNFIRQNPGTHLVCGKCKTKNKKRKNKHTNKQTKFLA